MYRTIRILALCGAAVLALAACSHKNDNAPLAYVPADTPYLVANLEPLTDDARDALMQASAGSALRANQVSSLRIMADELAGDHKNDVANLLRAFADSMEGKTYAQMAIDAGIDPNGLFAIYGLGLSPVMRGQLSDPDKFHAYIAGLEKAYGHPFARSTLDKVSYQHVPLGQSRMELVVAAHDKQFVVALLPAKAEPKQLRLALGLDHPEHAIQDNGRLKELADANGYGPYSVGYVDTTRLPALIAGGKDPMLKALLSAGNGKQASRWAAGMPASCEGDLARIAARVPQVSFGYTRLKPKERVQQVDIRLAPDIVKAFQGTGTAVPGLGGDGSSQAMVDVAFALPVPKIRDFWLAQVDAVKDKPFTCPALASINKLADKAAKFLPRLSMPPIGELRGLRLAIDQYDFQGKTPSFRGRVLVASHNPDGLLNLAKAMVPGLGRINLTDNGQPAALPAQATSRFKLDEPVWVAMNKTALAIGIGKGEKDALGDMLGAAVGQGNTVSRARLDGRFYVKWLATMQKQMDDALDEVKTSQPKNAGKATQSLTRAKARLAAVQTVFEHIDHVSSQGVLTDHGIRFTADSRLK